MSSIPAIGIDLGTTNSCVGIWLNGKVEIIPNDLGKRITPSVVSFAEETKVGEGAKFEMVKNHENTVYSIKRIIGRKFTDLQVQNDMKMWTFKVVEGPKLQRPQIQIKINNEIKNYSPEQISAFILSKLKKDATEFMKREIRDAVITVPAYFNDSQRQATKDAGKIAGLNVIRIINEPTAAALAYGLDKNTTDKGGRELKIIVFDFGGGTFDVSLLELNDGIYKVIATSGDTHLGGDDIDDRLTEYCCEEFKKKYDLDIKTNKKSLRRLKIVCEKTKRILSYNTTTTIDIDAIMNQKDFNINISREKLEDLCKDIFEKTKKPLDDVLQKSKLNKENIDDIIMIGGSSRIPKIIQLVKEYFNGKKPNISINPDEAVAYGAAIQGAFLSHIYEKRLENTVEQIIPQLDDNKGNHK